MGRFSGTKLKALPNPATIADDSGPYDEGSRLLSALQRIHGRLIEEIDIAELRRLGDEDMRSEIRNRINDMVREDGLKLNTAEFDQFANDLFDEMTGLGPLEPLINDPTISDILINTHEHIYVERKGEIETTDVRFRDQSHLLRIINRIVSTVGRRVDETHPMTNARLLDGSRVNVTIPPIAVDGPLVSIRKFSDEAMTLDRLVELGSLPKPLALFLAAAIRARVSTVISGGTGSGKTTLLNALTSAIDKKERLITIEEVAELSLQQPHVARMETRQPNIEGKGAIDTRDLVKNALRMRPDRIIIGETRAGEAFDMLQAMNTGHEGSLTTLHANSPRASLSRIEQMIAMADMNIPNDAIRSLVASAIQLIIQVERLSDGKRRVISVSEIVGLEGTTIQLQEIMAFHRIGTDEDGNLLGEFRASGIRPRCMEQLKLRDLDVPPELFDPARAF